MKPTFRVQEQNSSKFPHWQLIHQLIHFTHQSFRPHGNSKLIPAIIISTLRYSPCAVTTLNIVVVPSNSSNNGTSEKVIVNDHLDNGRINIYFIKYAMCYLNIYHAKNTFGVKKVQPSKVRCIISGSECMNRLVTIRSDIRIQPRLSILNT